MIYLLRIFNAAGRPETLTSMHFVTTVTTQLWNQQPAAFYFKKKKKP